MKKTQEELDAGELYVHCPRCNGTGMVFAWTDLGNGFQPSRGEYFTCPCCGGTKEADRENAIEFMERLRG